MANAGKTTGRHIRRQKRSRRLTQTLMRGVRLIHEDPVALGRAIEILGLMVKKRQITMRDFYRVLNAPFAHSTFKRKLSDFAAGRLSFDNFMDAIDQIRERRVPREEMDRVVTGCREGDFYNQVLRLAMRHSASKSLVIILAIKRMKYLRKPAAEIEEAERITWGIHQQAHKWHAVEAKGNKEAMAKRKRKMRELEKIFVDKFV